MISKHWFKIHISCSHPEPSTPGQPSFRKAPGRSLRQEMAEPLPPSGGRLETPVAGLPLGSSYGVNPQAARGVELCLSTTLLTCLLGATDDSTSCPMWSGSVSPLEPTEGNSLCPAPQPQAASGQVLKKCKSVPTGAITPCSYLAVGVTCV